MESNEASSQDSENHLGEGGGQEDRKEQDRVITVSVNEQPVDLQGRTATGAGIKLAAIDQGVLIQPNFILQEELPNGTSRIVGDDDEVRLRKHLRFTAIAPDDNS